MSHHKGLFLQLALILAFLRAFCLAYTPCSSLQASLSKHKSLTYFSEGCTLQPIDFVNLTLLLIDPQQQPGFSQLVLDLSSPEDQMHLVVQKIAQDGSFQFKVITRNNQTVFDISEITEALVFEIRETVCTLSFKNSLVLFSGGLKPSLPYELTVQVLRTNPSFQGSTRKVPSRIIVQCPEGFFLQDEKCKRVCPSKFYGFQGICSACSDACTNGLCVSAKRCNPCKQDEVYWEQSGTCHEKCPETYFADIYNKICVKCSEGCVSCSYPDGLCNTYFKTDMIINITVSSVLLFLIILCACCWNKNKKGKEETIEEQPKQEGELQPKPTKTKGKSNHINKFMDDAPVGPYNVLPEAFENEEDEEEKDEFHSRRKKKRLTEFAQSKLLTISLSKPFEVDDSNEDKAIAHGSALLPSRPGSAVLFTSKGDSPMFKRRAGKKHSTKLLCVSVSRSEVQDARPSDINLDDHTPSPPQQSPREVPSPMNSIAINKESMSFLFVKNCGDVSPASIKHPSETKREEAENVKTVEEAEEGEEIEENIGEDEEEKNKKEGYEEDSSLSLSKDKEDIADLASCTICGMNKRDCINRPCGHIIGCYACMEQFKESYAVCPRCKNLITRLEKVVTTKKKELGA